MGQLLTVSDKELNRIQMLQRIVDNGLNQTAIKDHYPDFGPTLAAEKLKERHGLTVSIETVRNWMIEAGFWKTRAQRLTRAYQPRYRRDCYGELIQIDGSNHAWFEDRAPKCTLLVFVDDATSALMALKFVDSESTYSYFETLNHYLQMHGRPIAFYSDKLGVFRVNHKNGKGSGEEITQFARALHELNIDIICANSCQAKGRVERANSTLQDRLVKELRLRAINDVNAANLFLDELVEDYNRRFKKEPLSSNNAHRPLESHHNLKDILCWKESRTLSENLTIRYDKRTYLIADNLKTRKMRRKKVTVYDSKEGDIRIYFEDKLLPYSILFDRLERIHPGAITENKRLGAVLQFVKEQQEKRNEQRSKSLPRKRA